MKKFTFAIGNPPYQEMKEDTSDSPVYDVFMDAAYEVADKVELITPGRFLFNAGKTKKEWNEKMLNDPHLKVFHYEEDASKMFPNTEIKGGVAITYRDSKRNFGAIEHFIPNITLREICIKVIYSNEFTSISGIINSTEHFKLCERLYEDHPEYLKRKIIVKGKEVPLVSKGHEYDLTSNILDKNPAMFYKRKPMDGREYVRVFGRKDGSRGYAYLRRDYLAPNEGLDSFKVVLPESNNNGNFGETLVDPFVAEKDVATTQTFITMGFCKNKNEAEALLKYIKGKFARALLGTLKITQHNKRETWRNVPLQDFTAESDIDWNTTIGNIDKQLYKKYNLTDEEIDFIETHVKEME